MPGQENELISTLSQVEATDNDEGENAEITYSIYHVSNNGLQKFKIDPKTGVIETMRKLNAGEQYSITVQATDKGGKYSQTIVEVNVIPGPNTRSPVFQQPVYEVQVSEGASINSTVATITVSIPSCSIPQRFLGCSSFGRTVLRRVGEMLTPDSRLHFVFSMNF